MSDPLLCIVCSQVEPDNPPVCTRDRLRLAQALWELRDLHALLPFALVPGQGARQPGRVQQVEAPLPLRDMALDLNGRTATYGFRDSVQDYRGDQTGAQPVAAILDSWARDWSAIREDEELPDPTVDALVAWLSRRLPWALDVHPAIDEFARELTVLLYTCRTVLAVSEKPIYSPDACPSCSTAALRRQPGDARWRCRECKEEVEVDHPETCECPRCKPEEEPVSDARYLMPRDFTPEHEAARNAIHGVLYPISVSTVVRRVELTCWREGLDVPLVKSILDTNSVWQWGYRVPAEATHISIRELG